MSLSPRLTRFTLHPFVALKAGTTTSARRQKAFTLQTHDVIMKHQSNVADEASDLLSCRGDQGVHSDRRDRRWDTEKHDSLLRSWNVPAASGAPPET